MDEIVVAFRMKRAGWMDDGEWARFREWIAESGALVADGWEKHEWVTEIVYNVEIEVDGR